MITLVEALGFRCLRYVSRPMDAFHVLVGPNASGKTTFLDVVAFLGDLVSGGIEKAVGDRTANFQDLTWRREGGRIELAVEVRIPEELRSQLNGSEFDTVRYEVALGLDADSQEIQFQAETAILKMSQQKKAEREIRKLKDKLRKLGENPIELDPTPEEEPKVRMPRQVSEPHQLEIFPRQPKPPSAILAGTRSADTRTVLNKVIGGNDNFYSETYSAKGKGWAPAFKLGPRRSALANLPEDESKFPVAIWLKSLLSEGVQRLILDSQAIREASPPGQGRAFRPDGSNLPWVLAELERRAPDRIQEWIAHLQTALPDLEGIRTVERPDDKHCYLMLRYRGDVEIPSWMVSDGTLRLLVLTLPAYLPDLSGIYLIEEPENGIHPRAVETMFQSLSSVYGAQILLATHSPVILSLVEPEQLLCFAKTPGGATDIVLGSRHPALSEWRGETNLSVLFASGVLGYDG